MNLSDLSRIQGGLLQKYTVGAAPPSPESAAQHFEQAAAVVDPSTLASALGAMMRSDDTPAFAQIASQLFGAGDPSQKAALLNALLAGASPAALGQISTLIPTLAGAATVTPDQAQDVPGHLVAHAAAVAEDHHPSILDKMSSVYAAHPGIVKALGTGAMVVALRELAQMLPARGA